MVIPFGKGVCFSAPATPSFISRRLSKGSDMQWRKEPPDRRSLDQCKDQGRKHIFQRIQVDRDHRALEEFFWFFDEWEIINQRFVKKFGKRLQHILMDMQHLHRVKKENLILMENVRKLEDREYGNANDAWQVSLRDVWEISPGEWRGFKFPSVKYIPPPKEVERIGYADRLQPPLKYFDHADAHLKKHKKEWGRWEKYSSDVADRLRTAEPHYPEFSYLKVFGERVRQRLPKDEPFVCNHDHQTSSYQRGPLPARCCLSPALFFDGPVADLGPARVHFACKPGEVVSQTVRLENLGSTVLFYRWERMPLPPLGGTIPKRTLGAHVTNCRAFSVINGTGSVLSGEAKEFVFKFCSEKQGAFLESWVLRIAPKLRFRLDPIYLHGVATLKDEDRILSDKLTKALNHRELMRGIGETLESIQGRVVELSRPTEEFRNAEYMYSSEAFGFVRKNLCFETPIYFTPSVYHKFEVLARVVNEVVLQQTLADHDSRVDTSAVEGPVEDFPGVLPPQEDSVTAGTYQNYVSDYNAGGDLDTSETLNVDTEAGIPYPASWGTAKCFSFSADTTNIPDSSDEDETTPTTTTNLEEFLTPGSRITTAPGTSVASSYATSLTGEEGDGLVQTRNGPGAGWDGCVARLLEDISRVRALKKRKKLWEEFEELLRLAQIPPHQTALFHVAMYHTLHDLANAAGEIFEEVTEKFTRPTATRMMHTFYANYFQEKAERDERERLEAESFRESGSIKSKEELAVMLDELEKETVDAASPAENEEMLTYCFKWIQIMTELRIASMENFNPFDAKVAQEKVAVIELLDQKMAATSAEDEASCWNIFSLERQKLELVKEFGCISVH